MARICPLFSGSSGNSTYIGGASGGILIDAGMSFKTIKEALIKSGSDIENIKAIAVTHEHYDHIKGLRVLLKQTKVPVIASEKTLKALETAQLIPESTKIIPNSKSEILLFPDLQQAMTAKAQADTALILQAAKK